jgi:hypothetical protein
MNERLVGLKRADNGVIMVINCKASLSLLYTSVGKSLEEIIHERPQADRKLAA